MDVYYGYAYHLVLVDERFHGNGNLYLVGNEACPRHMPQSSLYCGGFGKPAADYAVGIDACDCVEGFLWAVDKSITLREPRMSTYHISGGCGNVRSDHYRHSLSGTVGICKVQRVERSGDYLRRSAESLLHHGREVALRYGKD